MQTNNSNVGIYSIDLEDFTEYTEDSAMDGVCKHDQCDKNASTTHAGRSSGGTRTVVPGRARVALYPDMFQGKRGGVGRNKRKHQGASIISSSSSAVPMSAFSIGHDDGDGTGCCMEGCSSRKREHCDGSDEDDNGNGVEGSLIDKHCMMVETQSQALIKK